MGDELKKLRKPMKPTTQQGQTERVWGSKKRYFDKELNEIFNLMENHGAKYPEILEAAAREGVIFSYEYFRRLIAKAKKTRLSLASQEAPSAQDQAAQPTTSTPAQSTNPPPASTTHTNGDLSPEKAALKAEIERIKTLKISSKERRDLMTIATDTYSKTQNPLDRK